MVNIFDFFYEVLSSYPFLFAIECASFLLKSVIFFWIALFGLRSKTILRPWIFLIFILLSSLTISVSWIIFILRVYFFPLIDPRLSFFMVRIAWAATVILYQSLGLFFESLIDKNYTLPWYQKLSVCISSILIGLTLYIAFFQFNIYDPRPPLELQIFSIVSQYVLCLLIPILLYNALKIKRKALPKILKKQLYFLQLFLGGYIIADYIQVYPFSFFTVYVASNTAVVNISTLLLVYSLYYCVRRMFGLRFLNFQNHVQSTEKFNFINDFRNVLDQLGCVTNIKELIHITKIFFKDAMSIPTSRTTLYIRNIYENGYKENVESTEINSIAEQFISCHSRTHCSIAAYIDQHKILIYDELVFSNFYEEIEEQAELIHFMDQLDADIFVPIYANQMVIAYIIIERDARLSKIYSNVERDEMIVFATYLGKVIHFQQQRNFNDLIRREKELQEELYRKHQEIYQYQESIRLFMRDSDQRKIGVIIYRNRKFTFANEVAKELVRIDPNAQEGHHITKNLWHLIHQVERYNTAQIVFTKDSSGTNLVCAALPHLENNSVVITLSYPEIADVLKKRIDLLHNPGEWYYLLYLETTKSGLLINQLIPSNGERLLNFKIELLKFALSKSTLLLELPEKDVLPAVEILHHISMRETLHVLTLHDYEHNFDTAMKLFGISSLSGQIAEQPLFEKLNNQGTLFINNVHFLSIETQQYLLEFIRFGYYHVFKGDRKKSSNVRIICSTNQHLSTCVQEGTFLPELFQELQSTTISMPPLYSLPPKELDALIEGFTEQVLNNKTFDILLQLSNREKKKLIAARPSSVQELKERVYNFLVQKSKKSTIYQESQFDPAYNVANPDLIKAKRLGKKALKDQKLMAILWGKFNKNQSLIAKFLGVYRSSVSRRCREYGLQ